MALFNEILAGRFNRALQKIFGLKGPPPASQLGTEIVPVSVTDDQLAAEVRYISGWGLFGFASQQSGAVGLPPLIRLRNPKTSGVVACFFKLAIASNVAADVIQIRIGGITTDLAGGTVPGFRYDLRGPANSNVLRSQAAAAAGLTNVIMESIEPGINTVYDFILTRNQEVPIGPGDAIEIVSSNNGAAVTLTFTVCWRERLLEDSELT